MKPTNQNWEYVKLRKGLGAFPLNVVAQMGEETKRSIVYKQNKYWQIVNALKQLQMTAILNRVFKSTFPEAPYTETLGILLNPLIDSNFRVDLKLDIPKEMIMNECRKQKLLA